MPWVKIGWTGYQHEADKATVDTEGDIYLSMTTVNTDTDIFKMYLTRLSMQLDHDRPNFR